VRFFSLLLLFVGKLWETEAFLFAQVLLVTIQTAAGSID
jgi:hypothetical protein